MNNPAKKTSFQSKAESKGPYQNMDFVRSNFGTNEPLPVEHFFPHFLAEFSLGESDSVLQWDYVFQQDCSKAAI